MNTMPFRGNHKPYKNAISRRGNSLVVALNLMVLSQNRMNISLASN